MSETVGLLIIMSFNILEGSSSVQMNLTATEGQVVTLPCRAPNTKLLTVVEWSRPELEKQYVFLFLDGHPDRANQHPYFKDRVDLLDRQMMDGDVSLVLNNAIINDTGTYECRVYTGTNRRRRANLKTDPICIVYLRVDSPGQPGHTEDGRVKNGHIFSVVIVSIGVVSVTLVGLCFKRICEK